MLEQIKEIQTLNKENKLCRAKLGEKIAKLTGFYNQLREELRGLNEELDTEKKNVSRFEKANTQLNAQLSFMDKNTQLHNELDKQLAHELNEEITAIKNLLGEKEKELGAAKKKASQLKRANI
ncbi:MAG: hypothetical protein ACR5KV_06240 [Wolbachia sp.]